MKGCVCFSFYRAIIKQLAVDCSLDSSLRTPNIEHIFLGILLIGGVKYESGVVKLLTSRAVCLRQLSFCTHITVRKAMKGNMCDNSIAYC